MTVSMSIINKTGTKSELPQTEEMKTQKLYTGSVRNVHDALTRKVGRIMMMHGPPRLSLQDQKENKPIPTMPTDAKDRSNVVRRNHDGNTLFTTRGKISQLSKGLNSEISTVGPLPRTETPYGAIGNSVTQNIVNLKTNNNENVHPPKLPEPNRTNSLIEAEQMANRIYKLGNFSSFGLNANMRA